MADSRSGDVLKAGVNALTVTFLVGVLGGLLLTPDGRQWLRNPTVMLGDRANASAPPESLPVTAPATVVAAPPQACPQSDVDSADSDTPNSGVDPADSDTAVFRFSPG